MVRDNVICCCWKIQVWKYAHFSWFNIFFHLERWLCLLGQSFDSHCHSEGHSRRQGILLRIFRQQRQDKSFRSCLSIVSGWRLKAVNDISFLSLYSPTLSSNILRQYGSYTMPMSIKLLILSPRTGQ